MITDDADRSVTRVLLVTPDPQYNSLGRTYCIWLLAKHLGWTVTVVSVDGSEIWEPLRDSEFGQGCITLDMTSAGLSALDELVSKSDVVVAIKPLPTTLGAVHELAVSAGRPVIADVDDPDVEVRTRWRPIYERVPRRLLQPRYREMVRLGRLAQSLPTIVSNPVLQDIYGGVLVPHVREAGPLMPIRDTDAPVIRFIGSPKGHKGVDVLRAAVARLAGYGYTLEVTAPEPPDAQPWERWLGRTTFARGQELAASADITVIPSLNSGWAPAQLPAKLIDAMMFGRAVVASDIAPIRWALGGTGLLVPPGDEDALVTSLRLLRDRSKREELGTAAHARALQMFSVESVAPVLGSLVAGLRAEMAGRVKTE